MSKYLLLFILLNVFALRASGAEMMQFGETVRSFGMGGVRIPGSTDPHNFMWNPAALAFNNGIRLTMFNMGGGLNGTQAVEYARELSSGTDINGLTPFYGKPLWVGGGGYAALAVPYIGLGYYTQAHLDFVLENPAFPNVDMTYFADTGTIIGGALPIGNNFAAGLSVKRIQRTGGHQEIGTTTLTSLDDPATLIESFQNAGSAIGFDLGVMYRGHDLPMNPTVSLGWQDVGSTAFTKTGGSAAPDPIKDNMTASVTIDGDSLLAGFSGGLEYRHIGNSNEQIGKKIHLGAELSLPIIDLRAGFYQGYTSYGVGLDLFLMQFDIASYTVEKGVYPGQTPDGRIQVGLSISIGFDPSFELMEFGGKKRKVKQRR